MRLANSIVLTACLLLMPTAVLAAEVPAIEGLESEVHVIERGEEPWQLLRYDWTVGSTESSRTDYRMSLTMAGDGEQMSMAMPMSMEIEATVTEVAEDGSAWLEIIYKGLDVGVSEMTIDGQPLDDAVLQAMAEEFDEQSRRLIGSSGWEVYDDRGRLLDWGIDAPEAFPEDLRAQVEQMSATPTILPEEPVGVGAIWNVASSISESGIDIGVTEVNELLTVEGDRLELDTRIELGASGGIPASELGSAADGMVDEMTIRGDGGVIVDLSRVFSEMVLEMDLHMEMSSPDGVGGTSAATMDIEMDMEISPV